MALQRAVMLAIELAALIFTLVILGGGRGVPRHRILRWTWMVLRAPRHAVASQHRA